MTDKVSVEMTDGPCIVKKHSKGATRERCSLQFVRLFYFCSSIFCSLVMRSQDWLPTVQLVLQADWQVLLHSPQPTTFLS